MNHTRFLSPVNRAFVVFAMMCAILLSSGPQALAQARPVIIRDTEIEAFIKQWADPVIRAADLTPEQINIILVQDPAINAFVAGGPNIFIYTGLLTRTDDASEIVGVIAHELGHIRGGHLVRMRGAMESASYESLLGTLLGLGAALATGEGGLGTAIVTGTSSMAQRKFLSFSRVQESSADQAALTYMEKASINPQGLKTFMHKLESEELLPSDKQSEYVRTHPLTHDRIESLDAGYKRSSNQGKAYPPEWQDQHARMIAKLKAFITPERVAWDYDDRNKSIPARYARAIAAYRENQVKDALREIDDLLAAEPQNPFFWELKGQMLVDFGRVSEALPAYKKSLDLYPNAPLIRTAYAHALIETAGDNKATLQQAVNHLERSLREEPRSGYAHHLLATAYGQMGQEALAKLHLAEEALLKGQTDYAKKQVEVALRDLEKGSAPWIRAQDILAYIEQGEKKG
ncbi:MAG: M48 family metalloprotease [Rhodospirillales bacterium]|nr:M48 family metalloprotease [Rhodospirillales bacterium]